VHSQVREECFNLRVGGEEILARPHALDTDDSCDPLHRGVWVVDFSSSQTYNPAVVVLSDR
jgi:hypothetical protein